jgi:peroxiredoxin
MTARPPSPLGHHRASRVLLGGLLLVPVALLAAGCSGATASGTGSSDTGFVSGDGTLTVLKESVRQPAPTISGPTLEGGTFDLAEQRGQVVVLNVWGSWCGPCRAEAPQLERAAVALAPKGVQFVGLNTRDKPEPAKAFIKRFGITFPSLSDPDGRLQLGFRDTLPPAAIPSTLVIDREGRVAARIIGPLESQSTLVALVEQVLDGAPATTAPASSTPKATS